VINDILVVTNHERMKGCVPLALGPLGMYINSGPPINEIHNHFHHPFSLNFFDSKLLTISLQLSRFSNFNWKSPSQGVHSKILKANKVYLQELRIACTQRSVGWPKGCNPDVCCFENFIKEEFVLP
jgi:hypothetical protein